MPSLPPNTFTDTSTRTSHAEVNPTYEEVLGQENEHLEDLQDMTAEEIIKFQETHGFEISDIVASDHEAEIGDVYLVRDLQWIVSENEFERTPIVAVQKTGTRDPIIFIDPDVLFKISDAQGGADTITGLLFRTKTVERIWNKTVAKIVVLLTELEDHTDLDLDTPEEPAWTKVSSIASREETDLSEFRLLWNKLETLQNSGKIKTREHTLALVIARLIGEVLPHGFASRLIPCPACNSITIFKATNPKWGLTYWRPMEDSESRFVPHSICAACAKDTDAVYWDRLTLSWRDTDYRPFVDLLNYGANVLDHHNPAPLTEQDIEAAYPWCTEEEKASRNEMRLLFGVEYEIHVPGSITIGHVAGEIMTCPLKNFFIAKSDASIGRGFELCSVPATLNAHRIVWTAFFNMFGEAPGIKTLENTGLHVHVTKAALSPLIVGKLLAFYNKPMNSSLIKHVSRREPHNQWSNILSNLGIKAAANPFSTTKYSIVNTVPLHTIEIRCFKAPTTLEEMLAAIQFVDATVQFCKETSMKSLGFDSFLGFVEEARNQKQYRELHKVLATFQAGSVIPPIPPVEEANELHNSPPVDDVEHVSYLSDMRTRTYVPPEQPEHVPVPDWRVGVTSRHAAVQDAASVDAPRPSWQIEINRPADSPIPDGDFVHHYVDEEPDAEPEPETEPGSRAAESAPDEDLINPSRLGSAGASQTPPVYIPVNAPALSPTRGTGGGPVVSGTVNAPSPFWPGTRTTNNTQGE